MQQLRFVLPAFALFAVFYPMPRLQAQTRPESDRVKIELEVDALSALVDLQLTPDQINALKDLASDTAATVDDSPAHADADYQAALKEVRNALLSHDEDRIDQAQDKLAALTEKQDPDSEPDFENTSAAKAKAPDFLKTLSVSQIAHYIAQNADDIDDPGNTLVDALHQSRTLSDDDFASFRDDTAEELGLLAGGTNPSRSSGIIQKVAHFLNRARKLSPQEYDAQKSSLEEEARKLGEMDPIPCLRHWMEGELADLLSNPQLQTALKDWEAASKNSFNKTDQ
jgi:hypothetical protein